MKFPPKKNIRRGRGESKSEKNLKNSKLVIIGNNTAGLNGKVESLKRLIQVFQPAIMMLQEVKLRKPGLIRLKEFIIFEKHRENNSGGGLMTIAHEKMQPIQIHDENSEFLQVDINGGFGSIRIINCYGPQENLEIEVRKKFFLELGKG